MSVLSRIAAAFRSVPSRGKTKFKTENRASHQDREKIQQLSYTVRGEKKRINIHVKPSIYRSLHQHQPAFHGDYRAFYLQFLAEPAETRLLTALSRGISNAAGNADDAARIAISLVQHIPYDEEKTTIGRDKDHMRYPYEVLYDGCGICGEKSILLGYLLASFGFGVALLEFDIESHMAVGILSKPPYTFPYISYAFVESTRPTIATDMHERYRSVGLLRSQPTVIPISNGRPFLSIEEEYRDAQMWHRIQAAESNLPFELLNARNVLIRKYGLQ